MFESAPPLFLDVAWRVGALLAAGALAIVLLDTRGSRSRAAAPVAEKKSRARASLWPRFWVWVAGTALLLTGAGAGRAGFGGLLALLSIQAVREVTGALRACGVAVPVRLVAIAAPVVVFSGARWSAAAVEAAALASLCIAPFVIVAARAGSSTRVAGAGAAIATLGYVALPLAALAGVRASDDGFALVSWLLVVVVLSDTLAMFGGLAFGRHQLAPRISPGKTLEGVAAGCAGALAGAALMQFAFSDAPVTAYFAAALSVGGAGLAGDLVASMLKRTAGLGDFSRFLPGHGGLMDRLDSILFSVPVLVLFERIGAFG